uniref:Flagellar Assembly Protein A N-terminal region domain-containing protein n=1 Tax=Geobacter sp. (strain M21) TaxID=443144 RepID=C6E0C9_GEOSM
MQSNRLEGTGIAFKLSPDQRVLTASFTPVVNKRGISLEQLQEAIAEEGYGDLFISQDALGQFLKKWEVSPMAFSLQIGERRDATLAIQIPDDMMQAVMTIQPAYGGRRITVEEVEQELAARGVVCGILYDEIRCAVEAGEASKLVIAAGTPPVPGEDTQFISLIPEITAQAPRVSDDDTADYRNLGDIVSVSLGDPLLRRTHPTTGIAGMNLLGVELPTTDGVELSFAENLTGIACDLTDCDLLIAAISGHPVIVPRGVIVDPVFKVKRVDLSTGNLHFKGSLDIEGDVLEGMEVSATQDINVGGIVEAARVKAGGNIVVSGGVIGHGKGAQGKVENRKEMAQLEAGGSVWVQFAENALINAGGEIVVKELSMQSELTSGSSITVGEKGARKGHLIGGVCRAVSLVHAVVVGSHAGVPTAIEVGVDPALNKKLEIVLDALAEKGRLIEELAKTLAYVRENPGKMEPGLLALKERIYAKYQAEIAELNNEKKRLEKRMEINAQARVEVERDAFLGTQIKIGSTALQIEEDLTNPTFALGENGIIYS